MVVQSSAQRCCNSRLETVAGSAVGLALPATSSTDRAGEAPILIRTVPVGGVRSAESAHERAN